MKALLISRRRAVQNRAVGHAYPRIAYGARLSLSR